MTAIAPSSPLQLQLQNTPPLHLELQNPTPGPLHLELQRSGPQATVRWGNRTFNLQLVQISDKGDETAVPIDAADLTSLITKAEAALSKLQNTASLRPEEIRQINFRWEAKKENDKISAYAFSETTYFRHHDAIKQKVPLIINGQIERSFPEIKPLEEWLINKLIVK